MTAEGRIPTAQVRPGIRLVTTDTAQPTNRKRGPVREVASITSQLNRLFGGKARRAYTITFTDGTSHVAAPAQTWTLAKDQGPTTQGGTTMATRKKTQDVVSAPEHEVTPDAATNRRKAAAAKAAATRKAKAQAPAAPAEPGKVLSEAAAKAKATHAEALAAGGSQVCMGACGLEKPLTAFPTTSRRKDGTMGRGTTCRACRDAKRKAS